MPLIFLLSIDDFRRVAEILEISKTNFQTESETTDVGVNQQLLCLKRKAGVDATNRVSSDALRKAGRHDSIKRDMKDGKGIQTFICIFTSLCYQRKLQTE